MNKLTMISIILGFFIAGSGFFLGLQRTKFFKNTIDMNKALTIKDIVPVVVIGSGAAGYPAALYTSRFKLKTVVILGNKPGGALTETTYVENWPGKEKILGPDLIKDLQSQAKEFGAALFADSVQEVNFSQWPFYIKTEGGKVIYALTVIICTGSTPRMLDVPGERQYWGKGVTTCAVCDAPYYADKEVVVIGGGDSAIEEAMQLAVYAKKVTILVRKGALRAAGSMQEHLHKYPNIEVIFNSEVRAIKGNDEHVTHIDLYNDVTKTVQEMPINGVFLAIGHDPNSRLFKDYLPLDSQGYISLPDRTQQTKIPGVFVAGDVADNRYKQGGTASGDGIKAGIDAALFLKEHGFSYDIMEKMKPNFFDSTQESILHIAEIQTIGQLDKLIKETDGLVVVDFYAPYCPSCMRMLPALGAVAYDLVDKVVFVKSDISMQREIADRYKVETVPYLIVLNKNEIIAKTNNAMSKKELSAFMLDLIEKKDAKVS